MNSKIVYRSSLVTGLLAAVGATACCVLPLLLVTLGLSGAWMASLRALEAFQPLFIVLTIGSLGYAFYSLYIQPRQCAPDEVCASPAVLHRQRIVFWLVMATVMLLGLAFFLLPYLE